MKKIAIIIENITRAGGTERATVNLANNLQSLAYDLTIISLNGTKNNECYFDLNKGINIEYLNLTQIQKNLFRKFTWYHKYIKLLKKHIKNGKFDFVIGTGHAINSLLPLAINRNVKIIACEHMAYGIIPISSRLIRNISYKFVDSIVVLTSYSEKKYEHFKKVTRIPNSLPFNVENVAALENKQILTVGRLSIEKGYDRLINMAPFLKKNYPEWKIKIVGGGDLYDELMELCCKLDVSDYIIFKPFTKDIISEYLDSSIYVSTSYTEAFPMTFLEAKACGLPIVSYNCLEGPKDLIVNQIDGFLVEDNNQSEMLKVMALLMGNLDLRKTQGENSKNSSSLYHADRIKALWKDLLVELS